MSRTNCIDRAGQILIFSIWIEKRLVDLIILKRHPKLIKKLNNRTKIPPTMVRERFNLWEKGFQGVLREFLKEFNPKKCWEDNLTGILYWRDIIGHSHISLYRPYVLYRPDTKKQGKHPATLRRILEPVRKPEEKRPRKFTLLIRLSDDAVYNKMLSVIEELDRVYLSHEAEKLGISYEKIR